MSRTGDRVAVVMSDDLAHRLFSSESHARAIELGAARVPCSTPDGAPSLDSVGSATEVIVTGWDTPPLHEVINAAPALALIAHTGGSIRHMIPPSVYERGIVVTTVSAVLADAVAEFALMSMIAGLRRVGEFDRQMRAGLSWEELATRRPGHLLRGQTVGLVGASRVGRALIALLRPFGCQLLVTDPYLKSEEALALGVEVVSLDVLLRSSAVVSLHAPVLPSTAGMIGARELALIQDGGLLVNTARAALVDSDALIRELGSGRIRASLDVFDEEPLPPNSPWRDLPAADVTPHIAALTAETLFAQGSTVLDEIERHCAGETLLGGVSREAFDYIA